MKLCPKAYEVLFVYRDDKLTAKKLLDLFDNIEFSALGSNNRIKEDDVICWWRDYILDVEGMNLDWLCMVTETFFVEVCLPLTFFFRYFQIL